MSWTQMTVSEWTKKMRDRGIPSCTSKADYEYWLQAARNARPGPRGFCTDCTYEHQAAMKLVGRCDYPNRDAGVADDDDEL